MAKQLSLVELSEQIRDVVIEGRTTFERLQTLVRDAEEQKGQTDKHRDDIAALRQENALLRQRLDDHLKRVDTWDARRWSLLILLAGAVMSLASGLIVTLARK